MKMVTAIVKPTKFKEVREALTEMGVQGFTFTDVKGFGQQKIRGDFNNEPGISVNFIPKVLLQFVIEAKMLDLVIECIQKAAYTGDIGDGKILVRDVEKVVRIRTGETGIDAI